MTEVWNVVTVDTKRDISIILNTSASAHGIDAVELLGGLIAESGLAEKAARLGVWPDVSFGLPQMAVKWLGREVPGLTRNADGTVQDTPSNRAAARAWCSDASNAIPYCAIRYAALRQRAGDGLSAWCLWNSPNLDPAQNPHRGAYERGLEIAASYAVPPVVGPVTPLGGDTMQAPLVDRRGTLPWHPENGNYEPRDLGRVSLVTIHYTDGPTGQTVEQIAAWQTSAGAAGQTGTGRPFPSLAYHWLIDGAGRANYANDISLRTWHTGAVVGGVSHNDISIGVCFTGLDRPTAAQIDAMGAAIAWCEGQLGRQLGIEGHRDSPYPTACPGAAWPGWKPQLVAAVERHRAAPDATNGHQVSAPLVAFMVAHPEYGAARFDEQPITGGAVLWTTPTPQYPKGSLLIYRTWLDRVVAATW